MSALVPSVSADSGQRSKTIPDRPMKRPLPPHGAGVSRGLASGRQPSCCLYTGQHAWRRAERRIRTRGDDSAMVLPLGDDPAGYQWPAVRWLVVDATDLDGGERQRLAAALVRDGVRFVSLCDRKDASRCMSIRGVP
jgi:hypothetical protein